MRPVFPFALAAQVDTAAGRLVGMQGAHVQQAPNAQLVAGLDDLFGQSYVRLAKIPAAMSSVQHTDQVDDCIASLQCRVQGVRLVRVDLPHLRAQA